MANDVLTDADVGLTELSDSDVGLHTEEKANLAQETAKVRRERFFSDQAQAALGAAQNIARVAAIPATPILKLPRSEGTGAGSGLLNLGASAAEALSAPAYWMLPASRPLQALVAGQTAGHVPQSTAQAIEALRNPQATTAQKVEAVGAPILEAAAAAAITKGANAKDQIESPSRVPTEQQGVAPERPAESQAQAGTPQRGGEGEQPIPQPAEVSQAVEKAVQEQISPSGEVVTLPAIRLPNGKVNTGSIHALIPGAEEANAERGFTTNKGRFVTEDEADTLPREIIPMQPRGDLAASEISDPIRRESYLETEIKQSSNPSEIEDSIRELDKTRKEIARLGYVRRGDIYEKTPPSGVAGEAQPSAGPGGATMKSPVPAGDIPQAINETTASGEKPQVGGEPMPQGPGAATMGDVPQTSQLAQLTEAIGTQLSPNKPLGERISTAVNIADKWAKGKDAVTQGIAKARAASQALIDSYVNLPKWTNFRDAIGKWTGADQKTALEVYKFQKQIMKAVPDRLRQEAITNWIQADGDEALLRSRAEASKPNVRRGYEMALELTPAEKTLARNIGSYLDARLQEGLGAGLLKQGVDNYVTQVWKRSNNATKKLWADLFGVGTLNPNFKFARKRIFDSYFEGEQAGYTPKNKTIGNLVSQYDLAFNRALSARALIKRLQEGTAEDGKPITMTSGKTSIVSNPEDIPQAFLIKPNTAPEGAVSADGRPYRPIDHWALRDWKWATKGPKGEPVFVQGDMLVHPDHWKQLDNVLKTSRLRANPISGAILKGSALAKQTKLSISPFHTVQEGVHAAAHRVNPFSPGDIDLNNPIDKSLVDHGLMVMDPRSEELFAEGSSGGGLVGKIPGLGRLQQWYTEMTFKDYIPRLKMTMAKDALERNLAAYAKDIASGKVTKDQIIDLTARESNAAFGEQNYKMMGRSPNVQDVLRLGLLAPDFLEARFRFVGQALKPYGREQRIALALMFGALYTAARVMNKAGDDDYHWDKPFSVFYKGKEYRLRTLLGDVQHLITDPRSFWYNRLSPISRTVSEYITGRDDRGIKRSSAEQFMDFLSWFKPIPFQTRSDTTAVQQVLGAAGVPSKTYTKQQEVYELADKWMKNSTDPKVVERYNQIRQETLPDSPYRALRDALRKDDLKTAKAEYQKLRQTRNFGTISTAIKHNRPFTGSYASEQKFRASLTPDQRKVYDQAIKERRELYSKFLKAIHEP